jgi:predicted nucleic acid-binding Zn ribbon protein
VVQKLLSAPAIQFKGTGWYVTDYARKSSGGGGKSEGKGEAGASKDTGGAKDAGSSKDSSSSSSSSSKDTTATGSGSKK